MNDKLTLFLNTTPSLFQSWVHRYMAYHPFSERITPKGEAITFSSVEQWAGPAWETVLGAKVEHFIPAAAAGDSILAHYLPDRVVPYKDIALVATSQLAPERIEVHVPHLGSWPILDLWLFVFLAELATTWPEASQALAEYVRAFTHSCPVDDMHESGWSADLPKLLALDEEELTQHVSAIRSAAEIYVQDKVLISPTYYPYEDPFPKKNGWIGYGQEAATQAHGQSRKHLIWFADPWSEDYVTGGMGWLFYPLPHERCLWTAVVTRRGNDIPILDLEAKRQLCEGFANHLRKLGLVSTQGTAAFPTPKPAGAEESPTLGS